MPFSALKFQSEHSRRGMSGTEGPTVVEVEDADTP